MFVMRTLKSLVQSSGNSFDDDLSDCKFIIKNDYENHEVIKGHRVIFGSASPKFKAALYENNNDAVEINGVTASGFCFVKRFLYKDPSLENYESASLAIEVANFAHEWQLFNLYEFTVNSCLNSMPLSAMQIWALCEMLLQHGNMHKYEFAFLLLKEKCSVVISSEAWAKFASKDLFMKILGEDSLNIDGEEQLFDAVIKWGQQRALAARDTALWPYITHLVPFIRIRSISPTDFIDFVEKDQINSDCISYHMRNRILMCLSTNDEKFLPDGYCSNADKRSRVGKKTVFTGLTMNSPMTEVLGTPMQMQFSVSGSVYLFGVRLFSLEFLNFGEDLHIACHVYKSSEASEPTLLAEGEFRGVNVRKGVKNCVTLKRPILLRQGEQYLLKITNLKGAGRLVPDKYVPFKPKNTKAQAMFTFQSPYQPGDVYGLNVEYQYG